MKVIPFKAASRLPDDFADVLRSIADQVEAGEVTEFVAAFVVDGEYEFLFPSSLSASLVLGSLLQKRCCDRFTEGEL